ncbi:hypothetical protein A2U01_0053021, partial [Trifolium medium]|nr:hypothetical protein [Trifolium medium]
MPLRQNFGDKLIKTPKKGDRPKLRKRGRRANLWNQGHK